MNKNNQLAYNNSFLGFTDNRTALQAGKIEKCLFKAFRYDGVVMERRDAMLQDLRSGKVSVPSRGTIFLNTISWTPLVFWGYLPFCVANCFFWKYSFLWNEFLQVFPVFMRCVGNACKIPGFLLL